MKGQKKLSKSWLFKASHAITSIQMYQGEDVDQTTVYTYFFRPMHQALVPLSAWQCIAGLAGKGSESGNSPKHPITLSPILS